MASGGKTIKYKKSLIGPNAPEYLKLAAKDIGLNEANPDGSPNHDIVKYSKIVTGKELDVTDVPWCAYWVGGILSESGYPHTKSGMARSYLTYGTPVEDGDWKTGDIIVFWRGRKNDGVTGHVGFILSWDEDSVIVLGGNQGDEVCIQDFPLYKVLGVRRPRGISKSRTIRSAAAITGNELVVKPVVDMLPDPTPAIPAPIEAITKAQDSLGSIQPLVDTIGAWKPYIKVALTTLTIAFACLVIYYKLQDTSVKGQG